MNDEDINLELSRQFQEVRLRFVDDLSQAQDNLSYEKGEKEKIKRQAEKNENAIKSIYRIEETGKLDKSINRNRFIWYIGLPLGITLFCCLGVYLYQKTDPTTNFQSYIIAITVNVIVWIVTSVFITKPKLLKKSEKSKLLIEQIVQRRYEDEMK